MKIIINNIAASDAGALSILKSFYEYLLTLEKNEYEWIFILSDRYFEETDNIKIVIRKDVKKSWFHRLGFDLMYGHKTINSYKPDAMVSMQNTIVHGVTCPQVLYMHQSIPFQETKKFSLIKSNERLFAIYQYFIGILIKNSINRADKTVVQTNWIKEAVLKKTKIMDEKIVTILPPLHDVSLYIKEDSFVNTSFFYPASNHIYKNHACIYEASKILISEGVKDFTVTLTIDSDKSVDTIDFAGRLPFAKVMDKYNSSTLIFPSILETVGLPLMEAMQMGTIILAADCAYSREVLGEYQNAYFFDPFQPGELSDLMQKVIKREIKRLPVVRKMELENSWKEFVEVIEEQIRSGGQFMG